MLQGQRDLLDRRRKLILIELAPLVNAQHGVFYMVERDDDEASQCCKLLASYAYQRAQEARRATFRLGEGLVGQCALEKRAHRAHERAGRLHRDQLGPRRRDAASTSSSCRSLFEGEVKARHRAGVVRPFSEIQLAFLDQLTESIGIVLNTIAANMRTEELLKQSQALTEELQAQQAGADRRRTSGWSSRPRSLQASEELLKKQQEELQQTNEELEEKAQPARRAEGRGRAQEPRGRAGQAGARGEGRAARADLEVQVASSSRTCRTSCARRSTRC